MVKTNKKVNLAQLDAELKAGGLNMESFDGTNTITALDSKITDAQLQAAVDAHVAQEAPEPTIAEKLSSVGLSVADLKAALGL
jgi:antitoxin component HigA of HigAB toxin-antitoxin module